MEFWNRVPVFAFGSFNILMIALSYDILPLYVIPFIAAFFSIELLIHTEAYNIVHLSRARIMINMCKTNALTEACEHVERLLQTHDDVKNPISNVALSASLCFLVNIGDLEQVGQTVILTIIASMQLLFLLAYNSMTLSVKVELEKSTGELADVVMLHAEAIAAETAKTAQDRIIDVEN